MNGVRTTTSVSNNFSNNQTQVNTYANTVPFVDPKFSKDPSLASETVF